MLNAWLTQQEQRGDATVKQQISDSRKRLEEDRNQWASDVIGSVSRLADLDATFFRGPLAWSSSGDPNPSTITGNDDRAASCWAGIQARHDRDHIPPPVHETFDVEAGGSHAAAPQPCRTAEGGDDDDNTNTHPNPTVETVAAEIEELAAEKRCARLEALAGLARQGLAAHWRAFFRDEIERTRMAATALDLTASRWAQRQRESAGALPASWRGREWESAATGGGAGGDGGDSGPTTVAGASEANSGAGEGSAVRGTGSAGTRAGHDASCGTDSAKFEVEGVAEVEDESGQRKKLSGPTEPKADEEDAADFRPNGGDVGDDDDSACVIVVRDVDNSGGMQAAPLDAEAEAPAASGQLVVFVGRTMAFHTSTIRSSHLESFHEENRRHGCSSFSIPQKQRQHKHRYRWLHAYPMTKPHFQEGGV